MKLHGPSRRDYLWLATGALLTAICFLSAIFIHRAAVPVPYTTSGITIRWMPAPVRHWQAPIDIMAKKYDIDPNLLAIIITLESGGYSIAKSEDNAVGLMQITAPTAQDIASKYLRTPVTRYDLLDPQTNIEFGAAYLAYLRQNFGSYKQEPSWDNSVELMAAGYNGGPGAAFDLRAGRGLEDSQTVTYSRDAFNMWRERGAATSPTYDRWLERGGSTLINLAKAETN